MQLLDGRLIYSATDLNNFLACEHLTELDLDSARGGLPRPHFKPQQAEILSALGETHEERYKNKLLADGKQVVTIADEGGLEQRAQATLEAMRDGTAVIYQATFLDAEWRGHADFLRRIDSHESKFGPWSYEVLDTKLARHTEPYFLLQLCYYSEHIARLQGFAPAHMYVVLGDGEERPFLVDDYAAYYRAVKQRFLTHVQTQHPPTYPSPVDHCKLCVWNETCENKRIKDDHLSLVANMTRMQTARLNEAGVMTLAQLGEARLDERPDTIKRATFEKISRQARLQLEQRRAVLAGEQKPYKYELLPVDPKTITVRGFGKLPKCSSGDVFFDMEGDPYFEITTGLEYLFGAYTASDAAFLEFWGCDRTTQPVDDRAAEKRAFEQFIDFVMARLAQFSDMHIYHYAPYEKSALQRLAQRHHTRENEVDVILRREILVDLYAVVRQSIVVGQPGYSIKKLEAYYKQREALAIKTGDQSILEFERWLSTRHIPERRDDTILEELRLYNEQDCISTHLLREWLLELKSDASRIFTIEIPPYAGKPPEQIKVANDKFAGIKERLKDSAEGSPTWLILQMLEYHWREEKPVWWRFHDRCATFIDDPNELFDDSESICDLHPAGDYVLDKKSRIYPLHFPAQQFKVDSGTCYRLDNKEEVGTLRGIKETADGGILYLRRGPKLFDTPLPTAITVRDMVPSAPLQTALTRFAEALLGKEPTKYRAATDILLSRTPRLRDRPEGAVLQPARLDVESVDSVMRELDESYLFIQGPPGAGKTYYGARLILGLLKQGKRVGVTANSHKAIHNLLDEIERVAHHNGDRFNGFKKSKEDEPEKRYVSKHGLIADSDDAFPPQGPGLFAGTAWAFCPAPMDQTLDFLFIDEAGQMALPQALAAITSARNVVLLGDPMQLSQVRNTSHPGDVGASILQHLLDAELHPVSPERGIFLSKTYRMHGNVCEYISDVMYDGLLKPAEGRNNQRVDSPGLCGTGLRFLPVEHQNNRSGSHEECVVIADEIEKLLSGTVTDVFGAQRALEKKDILVVTPYNVQVRCIRAELEKRPRCGGMADRIGTVDKFQGQEAYVVFFSTAASTPDDAPRGIEFVFDRNRLNVAVSRARAMAVFVGSPKLLVARCTSIEQARTLNGALRFVELARPCAF